MINCDILKKNTELFVDRTQFEISELNAIKQVLLDPVPAHISVKLKVYDHDTVSSDDLIAKYIAHDIKLDAYSGFKDSSLIRFPKRGDQISMKLRLKLECMLNYYGDHCQTYCENLTHSSCDLSGNQICLKGSECYKDNNPCSPNPCLNGGICITEIKQNSYFRCECVKPWYGGNCTSYMTACDFAENINITSINKDVCENGGKCVNNLDRTAFHCECTRLWQGDRCQFPSRLSLIIIVSLLIAMPIFFVFILLYLITVIYKKKKLKRNLKLFKERRGRINFTDNQHHFRELDAQISSKNTNRKKIYKTSGCSEHLYEYCQSPYIL